MKTKSSWSLQRGLWGLCVALVLCGVVSVRAQSDNTIQVNTGEAITLAVDSVGKIAIAEPTVADVVSLSDHEISVIGKKVGTTTLTIVRAEGKPTQIYRIEVGNDAAIGVIRKAVSAPGMTVRVVGDAIVLDGRVDDELAAQRAVLIANAYYKDKVVNLLEVQRPRQIKIRTRVVEVNSDAVKNIGIQYFGASGQVKYGFGRVGISEGAGGDFAGHSFLDPIQTGDQTITPGSAPVGVEALLNLLITRNYAKLLSEPTLVTFSGKEASFLVGEERPIIQQLAQSFTVEFKEVGVRMKIKPTADSQNQINTTIAAEVSQVTGTIGDFAIPVISTKKSETTLQVKDGQTIVIAGLLDNNISKDTLRKVPWLGDIPILGALFRDKAFEKTQREVLFMVTPSVIKDVDADTAGSASTPLLREWQGEAGKNILPATNKHEDWGLHNPDRMGIPGGNSGTKTEKSAPAPAKPAAAAQPEQGKDPATNFSSAWPAGQ
jgi:pilus assembly protein CpaC